MNPREKRNRAVMTLVAVGAGIALFILVFCCGPTGLLSIRGQRARARQLGGELQEKKVEEILLRADIEVYQDTSRIRRIAVERLHMVPRVRPESGR